MKLKLKFTTFDFILMALMAALGIATKPIIVPLTHMITGPLFVPGGAVAGGFYMMWIALAAGLVGKRGAATITAIIQALIVVATGTFGSHGLVRAFVSSSFASSRVTHSLPSPNSIDNMFLTLALFGYPSLKTTAHPPSSGTYINASLRLSFDTSTLYPSFDVNI